MTAAVDDAAALARGWELPEAESLVFAPKAARYALVIPVINEGERIRTQLDRIAQLHPSVDVVIADGGSTDGSLDADFLSSRGVRALLTKRGPGRLSAQLRMAYAWVLDQGYDGVITVDGNGKDGMEAIPDFIAALDEDWDYVQGSRYIRGGVAINTPLERTIGGRLIHAPVATLASGRRFTDTTNGFRAYSRRFLEHPDVKPFRGIFSNYNLLFYLSVRAGQLDLKCKEIPVSRAYPANEKTPTKIAGWRGKFGILIELFRAATGAYAPPAPSRPAKLTIWSAALALAALLIVVVARARGLAANPDPWIDEAMLALNFPFMRWADILKPLPLFDQAAPLGYVALAKLTSDLAGLHLQIALRALSAVVSLASAILFFLTLKRIRAASEAALASLLFSLSPGVAFQSIEIKQYTIEAFCTVAVLAVALHAFLSGARTRALFLLVAVAGAALIFSIPAVFVTAGFGLALFLHTALNRPLRLPPLLKIAAAGVALGLIELVLYLGYLAPATRLQITAYAADYAPPLVFPPLSHQDLGGWSDLLWLFQSIFLYVWHPLVRAGFVVLTGLGFLTALFSPSRATRFVGVGIALTILATVAAAVLGLFRPTFDRHIIFLAPLFTLLVLWGVQTILRWIALALPARAPMGAIVTAALALVILAYAAVFSLPRTYDRQSMSPLIAETVRRHAWPQDVWVYYAAQPNVDLLTFGQPPAYLGHIPHESHQNGWYLVVRNNFAPYLARFEREMAGRREVYILTGHSNPKDTAQLLGLAEVAVGPCRLIMEGGGLRSAAELHHCVAVQPR